jgi:MFS family permease
MLNTFPRRRDLVVALVGRTVSTFGDGVALVALTLRLQTDGAHPYEVGLLLAAGTIPLLLLAPWVGRLVDNHDSRRLLVGGGVVEVAATIPLVIVHSVVAIVLLAAVLGGAACLTAATWSALIPRIVGEERIAEAVSAQQSLTLLVLVGAPAVGGLLAGEFGTGLPVSVDAASFVIVTAAAALVRTRRVPERVPTGSVRVRGGLAILRDDRVLAPLLAGVALVVLLVGMVDVVLVYLVRETLHSTGVWYGLAEASWISGMVAGSLGAGRVRTQPGQVRATIAGVTLACAAVGCFAVAPAVWVLVPLSVIGGVGNGCAAVCVSTLLTARTPDSARGRVSATANALFGGAQGGSLLLGAALSVALSPRAIYALAGLLGVSAAAFLAVTSISHTANAELPLGVEVEPSAAFADEARPLLTHANIARRSHIRSTELDDASHIALPAIDQIDDLQTPPLRIVAKIERSGPG